MNYFQVIHPSLAVHHSDQSISSTLFLSLITDSKCNLAHIERHQHPSLWSLRCRIIIIRCVGTRVRARHRRCCIVARWERARACHRCHCRVVARWVTMRARARRCEVGDNEGESGGEGTWSSSYVVIRCDRHIVVVRRVTRRERARARTGRHRHT